MKADIHPKYYLNAKVTCACGAKYAIGSTKESYRIDICAACHPFYTGKQKLVDTAGRVDKFMARQKIAAQKQAEISAREKKHQVKEKETVEERIIRKIRRQEEDSKPAVKVSVKKPALAKKRKPVIKMIAKKPIAKKPVAKKALPKKQIIKSKKK